MVDENGVRMKDTNHSTREREIHQCVPIGKDKTLLILSDLSSIRASREIVEWSNSVSTTEIA